MADGCASSRPSSLAGAKTISSITWMLGAERVRAEDAAFGRRRLDQAGRSTVDDGASKSPSDWNVARVPVLLRASLAAPPR